MTLINRFKDAGKALFSYRGLEDTDMRRRVNGNIKTQDEALKGKRQKAINTTLELEHNLSLAAWAVRTHLNFVSSFNFQARTADSDFNRQLEKFIWRKSQKNTFDVQRRMSLEQMFRSFNALKVWQGDAGILKCEGGKGQLIESWQIAKASNASPSVNENGLVLDQFSAIDKFAICGKVNGQLTEQRIVDYTDVIFDGFFSHGAQTRGHSPWMTSLNSARDLLDATEFYLLKAKLSSLFGLVIYRDHASKGGNDFQYDANGNPIEGTGDQNEYLDYRLNGAAIKLELDRQDKIDFIESKSPSQEFQEFAKTITRQILASLDIPYSAYDSGAALISGSHAASSSRAGMDARRSLS